MRRYRKEARRVVARMVGRGDTSVRFAPRRSGHCGEGKPAEANARVAMHIVDRRLNLAAKETEKNRLVTL